MMNAMEQFALGRQFILRRVIHLGSGVFSLISTKRIFLLSRPLDTFLFFMNHIPQSTLSRHIGMKFANTLESASTFRSRLSVGFRRVH